MSAGLFDDGRARLRVSRRATRGDAPDCRRPPVPPPSLRCTPRACRAVTAGPVVEGLLAGVQVLVPPVPRLHRRILEGTSIGEADLPGFGPRQSVNRVQMRGGHPVVLAARQEDNAGHGRGHVPAQAAERRARDLMHGGMAGALHAGDDHVGLEQHELQRDALLEEGIETRRGAPAGDLFAALDRMRSVHQHFGLDDRHELLLLTERGVSREGMRIRAHARRARQRRRDADNRPPLREAGAHAVIFREAIPQPVQSLGDGLLRGAGKRLRAGIDLDAGNDALAREHLGERRPAGALLTDGLVVQDGAADELGHAARGEQHLAVGAPALLSGPDPERVEPPGQGGDGLVGRENALAVGDQRRRDALQISLIPPVLLMYSPSYSRACSPVAVRPGGLPVVSVSLTCINAHWGTFDRPSDLLDGLVLSVVTSLAARSPPQRYRGASKCRLSSIVHDGRRD